LPIFSSPCCSSKSTLSVEVTRRSSPNSPENYKAMNNNNIKPLAVTFFLSGIWDSIGAYQYLFVIGIGRRIDQPLIDPFFAIFLGSFFLCFAYLQFLSAFNIRRYLLNVGCLILGRLFYVVQLYTAMAFVTDFPTTFWFTGIIDGLFVILYIFFAFRGGLSFKSLFWPEIERKGYRFK
jgi:hypothetical protein